MFERISRAVRIPSIALVAAVLVLGAQGCSLFADSRAILTVTATDPSAEIFIDGELRGTGTVQADVARDKSHSVMARVGNRVGVRSVGRSVSTTGILDIVGGVIWLIPLLGLLGAGFWDPEEDHVTVIVPHAPTN